jgi:hypothetical protein
MLTTKTTVNETPLLVAAPAAATAVAAAVAGTTGSTPIRFKRDARIFFLFFSCYFSN